MLNTGSYDLMQKFLCLSLPEYESLSKNLGVLAFWGFFYFFLEIVLKCFFQLPEVPDQRATTGKMSKLVQNKDYIYNGKNSMNAFSCCLWKS